MCNSNHCIQNRWRFDTSHASQAYVAYCYTRYAPGWPFDPNIITCLVGDDECGGECVDDALGHHRVISTKVREAVHEALEVPSQCHLHVVADDGGQLGPLGPMPVEDAEQGELGAIEEGGANEETVLVQRGLGAAVAGVGIGQDARGHCPTCIPGGRRLGLLGKGDL